MTVRVLMVVLLGLVWVDARVQNKELRDQNEELRVQSNVLRTNLRQFHSEQAEINTRLQKSHAEALRREVIAMQREMNK